MKKFIIRWVCFFLIVWVTMAEVRSETLEIEFKKGWNLISIPCKLENSSVERVFQNIEGKYQNVWGYDVLDSDDHWKHYYPEYASFSDLENIEPNIGYWIYVTQDSILSVSGEPVFDKLELSLEEGWNMLIWPFIYEQPVSEVLSSLPVEIDCDQIARFDAAAQAWEYFDNKSGSGQFEVFEPGRTYYIHVFNKGTIIISGDISPPAIPRIDFFIPFTNNPIQVVSGIKDSYSSIWVNGEEKVPVNDLVNWSISLVLTEGDNVFGIISKDLAGNMSEAAGLVIILDSQPPFVQIISPLSESIVSGGM